MWPALKSVSIHSAYLPPSSSFTDFNKPGVVSTSSILQVTRRLESVGCLCSPGWSLVGTWALT